MDIWNIKILLDENVPVSIKQELIEMGYQDVITIGDVCKGISDEEVIELAKQQGRLLITQDSDFKKLKSMNEHGILQFSSNIMESTKAINLGIEKALQLKNSPKRMFIRVSNKECYCEYPKNKYKDEGKITKKFPLNFNN